MTSTPLSGTGAVTPLGAAAETLLAKVTRPGTTTDTSEIGKAGRDFESLLLGQWLQGAETSFGSVPQEDGDEDQDPGAGSLREFAMQALGQAMAASGGVGIARMVTGQLAKQEPAAARDGPGTLPGGDVSMRLPRRSGTSLNSGSGLPITRTVRSGGPL